MKMSFPQSVSGNPYTKTNILDARLSRCIGTGMTFTWSSFPQLVSGNPERINYDVFTQDSGSKQI